ncbi:MAG: hypothetical protein VCA57_12605 [Pseudomonas sp.]|uniref:hypothetical protein n=1 Tax=Pseudomonas sp. TaxID=306 RepID=UPI0039823A7B
MIEANTVVHLSVQGSSRRKVFRKKTIHQQLMRLFASRPARALAKEACAGLHCLSREIMALVHGAKLISRQFVRPFLQRDKSDFIDEQARCEAVSRSSMRFFPLRTNPSQSF